MKTILALTDFTKNAENAAQVAVNLAGKLRTDVELFHNYQSFTVAPYYAWGSLVTEEPTLLVEENKQHLVELKEKLEAIAGEFGPNDRKPNLNFENKEGNLTENMNIELSKKEIELVVMGAQTNDPIDHLVSGSDTHAVIEHVQCPVLIVPINSHLKNLNKIVFATDFDQADIKAITYLIKLCKHFDTELEIVHVNPSERGKTNESVNEIMFKERIAKLKYPLITYTDIFGKDVVTRLYHFYKESKADVLAMVHHQHSFFGRLLQHSTTKEALAIQAFPVMVFPAKSKVPEMIVL